MKGYPVFRKLSAWQQLNLEREYPRLLPALLRRGLGVEDAVALSYNATLLSRVLEGGLSPRQVLGRYSLEEIAGLCEGYRQVAAGELEYGEGVAPL